MAKMIDAKPLYHGEAKLWESVEKNLTDDIIVYNNREVSGREFDFCLLIKNRGILIIEVKGWVSNKISVQGVDKIIVEGYDLPQTSPKKQSRAYRFSLINKIFKKYGKCPLVLDMVCYPFISKEDYFNVKLDLISEENLTIFKEDLEENGKLYEKIEALFTDDHHPYHAEFNDNFMLKLRQNWEPNFKLDIQNKVISSKPYSILSFFPDDIMENQINKLINNYFDGIKTFIFVQTTKSYQEIIYRFNNAFKEKNINPGLSKITLGYENGLKDCKENTKTFNLEIYYLPKTSFDCSTEYFLIEGVKNEEESNFIEKLSSYTNFNKDQYLIEHSSPSNNILVEAGAGTGKTTSMVSRIAYLCNKQENPIADISEEVVMVTFTNEASLNMKTRLKQIWMNYFIITGNPRYLKMIEDMDNTQISTIHKFALEIIRNSLSYVGLGDNFRITSHEYIRSQIYNDNLCSFLYEKEEENPDFTNSIAVPIYDLKKKLMEIADRLLTKSINLDQILPAEMGFATEGTLPYFNELINKVLIPSEHQYFSEIHNSNEIDLKEVMIILDKLINEPKFIPNSFKFKYLFIDEFQDTDDVQIKIFQKIQNIMNTSCKFFIVGDLKQSIYRFRGAQMSAFEKMKKDSLYKWDIYSLKINYRTDYRLLKRYSSLFESMGEKHYLPYIKDKDELESSLYTEISESNLFSELQCHCKNENAFFGTLLSSIKYQKEIIESIMKKRKLKQEERTIAILVRYNWQVSKIVEAARNNGIVIDTKSGGDLFQLESTIDLYKLLFALSNSSNPVALINLIESNYINAKLDYHKLYSVEKQDIITYLIEVLNCEFYSKTNKRWDDIIKESYSQPILYVLKQIFDNMAPWSKYSTNLDNQVYYISNYEFLMEKIIHYSKVDTLTLNQILEYLKINILTGQKQPSREIDKDEDDNIHILCTTVHKSKGLEYGTVILPYTDQEIGNTKKIKLDVNYSENKLSYCVTFENKIREKNSNYDENNESSEQITEEARILYVALTRAIRNCVWIHNLDCNYPHNWGTFLEE